MALPSPDPGFTSVITGASSGIGADIARELATRGHGVTLVARREDRLKTLADELHQAHGIRTEVIAADLTDPDSRLGIAEQVEARGLLVDILVNNAGLTTMGAVHKGQRAGELAMIRTNVEAVVDLCTIFLPGMTTRRKGAILNTASTAAFQPLPGQAGYGASKSFVLSYSWALGAELKGTGVMVTALCPGPVETGFAEAAGMTDEEAASALPKFMWLNAAQVAKAAVEGMEHGRPVVIPGLPNRIGAAAGYLAPRRVLMGLLARQHPALKNQR